MNGIDNEVSDKTMPLRPNGAGVIRPGLIRPIGWMVNERQEDSFNNGSNRVTRSQKRKMEARRTEMTSSITYGLERCDKDTTGPTEKNIKTRRPHKKGIKPHPPLIPDLSLTKR